MADTTHLMVNLFGGTHRPIDPDTAGSSIAINRVSTELQRCLPVSLGLYRY
jgi:hypothetical protein